MRHSPMWENPLCMTASNPVQARRTRRAARLRSSALRVSRSPRANSDEKENDTRAGADTAHSPPTHSAADDYDRFLRGLLAAANGGASYWAALQAWEDWLYHGAMSPGRSAAWALEAWTGAAKLAAFALDPSPSRAGRAPYAAAASDRRFRDPAWDVAPFDLFKQSQLALEASWQRATEPLEGVRTHHMRRVRFMGEQILHALAPSNFALTNPVVVDAMAQSGGACLSQGALNWLDDIARLQRGAAPFGADAYELGHSLAPTPGQVVFRNDVMELIQYTPATGRVHAEPILIVPAWIMKYYILDLAPGESLISYLVAQGFTVFCISWKNPDAEDSALSLDDYRVDGVLAALDAVKEITGGAPVHGVGYCLGGTILAIAAAALDRDQSSPLCTLSLLAAQTDFAEAGELTMFIDESQVAVLEDMMDRRGYLDARQMAGAFYALRANDMLWARLVERYLIGARRPASALDAWLLDATRMPALMHSQYLRWLFLENRFTQGNLDVDGSAAALKDIKTPIFTVGAELDHIAPWRSVYKIALFSGADTTFVLSGGGHNTAIVSPPGKPRAHYRVQSVGSCANYVDPDEWLPHTPLCEGSCWPEWLGWLQAHSTADLVAPPQMGARALGPVLEPAPGLYVRQR
jgi:polyhydroxyalkanoate synthase